MDCSGDYDKLGYGSKVHAQAAALATEAIRASLFDPRGMCCGALEHIHEWLSRTDPEMRKNIARKRRLLRSFEIRLSGRT